MICSVLAYNQEARSVMPIFSLACRQVVANMRGNSADAVADRIVNTTSYPGLQVCPPSAALFQCISSNNSYCEY